MNEYEYEITNLKDIKALAAKLRRWIRDERGMSEYSAVSVRGSSLFVTKSGGKPWAELAGHMTGSTEVISLF